MTTENIGNMHIIPDVFITPAWPRRTTTDAGLHIVAASSRYGRVSILTMDEPWSRYGRGSVLL